MKTALGLMSGTSMDGIDIALIRTDGESSVESLANTSVPYSSDQRLLLQTMLTDAQSIKHRDARPHSLDDGESQITDWHCDAVEQFLSRHQTEIDIIGFHGQTVLHRPEDGITVQLGLGETMAHRLNTDIIYDFRKSDMDQGGEGAPLACTYHRALCQSHSISTPAVFLNLGGIANVTYIDEDYLQAFDCGPANCLIDQWMQSTASRPYDTDGTEASKGEILPSIVESVLSNSFFSRPVPRSADRLEFPPLSSGLASLSDGARSLVYATALSISHSQEHFPSSVKTWILCGGGRYNKVLISDLENLLSGDVIKSDILGINGDALEAEAFAYLSVRSQLGLPLSYPTTTGCRVPTSGGILASP